MRAVFRLRTLLVRMRTGLKNNVHGQFHKLGIAHRTDHGVACAGKGLCDCAADATARASDQHTARSVLWHHSAPGDGQLTSMSSFAILPMVAVLASGSTGTRMCGGLSGECTWKRARRAPGSLQAAVGFVRYEHPFQMCTSVCITPLDSAIYTGHAREGLPVPRPTGPSRRMCVTFAS